MNEILISGNIDCTKKADYILEMPGIGEFCGYCFKVDDWMSQINSKTKDDFQVIFRGTPCMGF